MTMYNDIDSALKSFEMVGFSYHNFNNRAGHLKRIGDRASDTLPPRVEAVPAGSFPETATISVPPASAVDIARPMPIEVATRDEIPMPVRSYPAAVPLPEADRRPLTLEHVFRLLSSPEPH
ncbi:hypothetical protein SAMN04487843_12018 [Methylobacterium sp. ap11]|uniref:hypothetical protein n=1 Tax=Methylobacterium sp. ap11 TaxID=1761799 RepID=UPI0008C27091|nr:hypothetical protein [Methylobacterium sp. ap11]SEP44070.1 hypothetical protein SAMN04487843_12018 [Methylobacterium sp. ap11]